VHSLVCRWSPHCRQGEEAACFDRETVDFRDSLNLSAPASRMFLISGRLVLF